MNIALEIWTSIMSTYMNVMLHQHIISTYMNVMLHQDQKKTTKKNAWEG